MLKKFSNKKIVLFILLVSLVLASGVIVYRSSIHNDTGWKLVSSTANWEPRSNHCSIAFNEHLWIIGGYTSYKGNEFEFWPSVPGAFNKPTSEVLRTKNGTDWETFQSDPNAPSGNCDNLIVFNQKLWVIGNNINWSENGINWTRASDEPKWSMDGGYAVAVFKDKLWVIGGGEANTNKAEIWSSSNGTNWEQETTDTDLSPRSGHSLLVFKDKLWVIGGQLDTSEGYSYTTNDVWYSDDGMTWLRANRANWPGSVNHKSLVHNDKMVIIDGHRSPHSQNLRETWSSEDGVIWQQDILLPWHPRTDYSTAVFDEKIWVTGGHVDIYNKSKFNDTWYYKE